jgi:hypothetical protein
MSSKPKKLKRPTPIDPIFRVPTGAEGEFASTDNDGRLEAIYNNEGLSAVSTPFGVMYQDGTNGPDGPTYLEAPKNLVIYDQKIRRSNGVVVVDIVAQFDDVPNADRYELRVTKI